MTIERSPDAASEKRYDLIVVGGGIYGVMLALEATLRDCSVLLLEKEDFGGATSHNSLRIIHGGLRELRTFDLRRYWTLGQERRWFLEHFPHLVERLPVVVPLYRRGVMRPSVFRLAFWLDRFLLPQRDRTVNGERAIPYGRVLSPAEVKERFPDVDTQHLAGGALWHDACVPDSQRLIMEVLRAVCQMGGVALNYMPAVELLRSQGRVKGVHARDTKAEESHQFYADTVVNAAGPWSPDLARHWNQAESDFHPCLSAWNVLFDREAPAECAVGATPPQGDQHYFLHPWKGRLLIGTGHAPRDDKSESPRPSPQEMEVFLQAVNGAFPNLSLRRQDILRVFAGYLPAKRRGTPHLAKEELWIEHADHGGLEGLHSVQGTKFSAARSTAETGITRIFPDCPVSDEKMNAFRGGCREGEEPRGVFDYHWDPDSDDLAWKESLKRIVQEEAVVHLDDLIFRRTSLGDNPHRTLRMVPQLCDLFAWTDKRGQEEIKRIREYFPEEESLMKSNASPSRHNS